MNKLAFLWLSFVIAGLMLHLTACQPMPDAKLTDLPSFDDESQRDGLIHGNTAIQPPTEADNAKISIHGDNVTLAKAHVMSVKSARYQPAFRLEGVIIPHKQLTLTLPKEGKLDHLNVKVGSTVKSGDVVAKFYQEVIATQSEPPQNNTAQTDAEQNLKEQDKIATTSPAQDQPITSLPSEPTASHDTGINTSTPPLTTLMTKNTFELKSPLSGKVEAIFTTDKDETYAHTTPVMVIFDEKQIKFISPLPADFADYLAVGDGVNFDTEDGRVFGGQIEKILPNPKVTGMMDIHVAITPEQAKKAELQLGERVGGYVNYGQIDVGVLVPAFAIFDDKLDPMDLSDLTVPPHKPATPRPAFLWTVGQNERLALSEIVIIEYHPQSNLYLIAGIGLDGLIVLADLPKHVHGARVRLK